jgi:hypothetical protein
LETANKEKHKIKLDSRGAYFIYGWLKVGVIIDDINDLDPATKSELEIKKHPHLYKLSKGKNKIFLGAEYLDEEETIAGFGYFPTLNEKLRLSKAGGDPNIWELPGFFYRDDVHAEERLTRLKHKTWTRNQTNGNAIMDRLYGFGQEFVFDTSEVQEDFNRWLIDDLGPWPTIAEKSTVLTQSDKGD